MKNKTLRRFLFIVATIIQIISLSAYPALAISIPSADEIAKSMEERYHLDLQSIQSQGENFNSGAEKGIAPQVMISFDPLSPTLGEKITATAFPMYFSNPKEALYYTWYLKHPDCDTDNNVGNDDDNKKCDLNDDGKINVEDWKIEAMRILAGNGYNWNQSLGKDSTKCSGSNQPDYCSLDNQYETAQGDDDGYTAIPGGNDKEGMPAHCYIHDFTSGTNYELVTQTSSASDNICPDLGDGITRTAVCGKTRSAITSGAFNAGADVFTSQNVCGVVSNVSPTCSSSTAFCPDGNIPICVEENNIITNDVVGSDVVADNVGVSDSCENIAATPPTPAYGGVFTRGFGLPFSDTDCSSSAGNTSASLMCDDSDKQHLFPYPEDGSPKDTGDGSFGKSEEKFWHTNPNDPNTSDNGNVDEANIAGLGQYIFSWNYQSGDQVGVAVEGTSTYPTKFDDSSAMIMWALPKNKCEINSSYTSSYMVTVSGYDISIPTTSISKSDQGECISNNCLNNCLEDNLVDPQEGGQSANLGVSLSYSPKNPINDPSGNNLGDKLTITSSVQNAQDSAYLKYSWEVYKTTKDDISTDDTNWDQLTKSELSGAMQTSGIGLNSLSFNLNFSDSKIKYLKVKLAVTENITETIVNEGHSEVIIPISSSSYKLQSYQAATNSDLIFSKGSEICSAFPSSPCSVVKDEIIAVQINLPEEELENYDFKWSVDGASFAPFSYQRSNGEECLSGECNPKTGAGTNIVYFPILKEAGSQYSVNLAASNKTSGEKINLSRVFQVTEPSVGIFSTNENTCAPVLLGNYVDLDGKLWPDYSKNSFEAITGSSLSFMAATNAPKTSNISWTIDGTDPASPANAILKATAANDGSLSFTAAKDTGSYFNIAATGLYTADTNTKKALNKYWGVQLNQFYEKQLSASIEVKITESLSALAKNTFPKKPLASLFVGVSSYLAFLFRIILTVFLMFSAIGIIFSLFPKNNESKDF